VRGDRKLHVNVASDASDGHRPSCRHSTLVLQSCRGCRRAALCTATGPAFGSSQRRWPLAAQDLFGSQLRDGPRGDTIPHEATDASQCLADSIVERRVGFGTEQRGHSCVAYADVLVHRHRISTSFWNSGRKGETSHIKRHDSGRTLILGLPAQRPMARRSLVDLQRVFALSCTDTRSISSA